MPNEYTPGLKLRKPAQGDDYWDDDVNANCDVTEAALGRGSGIAGVVSGLAVTDGGGLSANWSAGSCRVQGGKFSPAASSLQCADDALNFIYVDAAGTVQVAASLPSPPYAALALVETAGGAIVRLADLRRKMVDALAEHDNEGVHTAITPTSVAPTGTDGAYRRSAAAGYQAPEDRVNNLILKNDPTPLISVTGKGDGWSQEYTASALGSGYVPADANGLIVCARVRDAQGRQGGWQFYPADAPGDDDIRFAAVSTTSAYPDEIYAFGQVMFRLSSAGKFILECYSPAAVDTAECLVRLIGWTEPA